MSKKQLILIAIALVIATIGIGIAFYIRSFKTAHFDFKKDNLSAIIYTSAIQDDKKITTLSQDGNLSLQAGTYYVVPQGDKYDTSSFSFTVDNSDVTVDINPNYSQSYRDQVLKSELTAINKAISDTYPKAISKFTINEGYIYQDATWYATTLTQKTAYASDQGDVYRTVLKKENATWVVKAKPTLVLSTKDYPDIPFEILSDINTK